MKKIIALIVVATIVAVNGGSKPKQCTASWYGDRYKGMLTASGSVFDPRKLTTAHRSLPFGTVLLVTLGPNHVIVTVTDRGPFVKGRDLDLSRAAFERLAEKEAGLIKVEYRILRRVTNTLKGQD
tara:strand:+ start:2365 stop:2739 length:375 start_codon:yes stop_codon:yes gene_type:complete